MRPIALGRSNWIHIGSEDAGPRIAAIFSVVESCRRLNIPVRDYLAAILPGLANAPLQRTAELTPVAWAVRHPHLSTVGLLWRIRKNRRSMPKHSPGFPA
jgi:transposase